MAIICEDCKDLLSPVGYNKMLIIYDKINRSKLNGYQITNVEAISTNTCKFHITVCNKTCIAWLAIFIPLEYNESKASYTLDISMFNQTVHLSTHKLFEEFDNLDEVIDCTYEWLKDNEF